MMSMGTVSTLWYTTVSFAPSLPEQEQPAVTMATDNAMITLLILFILRNCKNIGASKVQKKRHFAEQMLFFFFQIKLFVSYCVIFIVFGKPDIPGSGNHSRKQAN
jgi:hypothetical protein